MEQPNNKGVCPHCGHVHDEETDGLTDFADAMASSFTEAAFPEIWKGSKEELKELKKRELAEEMFYSGAVHMLAAFLSTLHEAKKEKK